MARFTSSASFAQSKLIPFKIWHQRNGICGKSFYNILVGDKSINKSELVKILLTIPHDYVDGDVECYATRVDNICNENEGEMPCYRGDHYYHLIKELLNKFKKDRENNYESTINGVQWLATIPDQKGLDLSFVRSYCLKKQIKEIS
jgi:hypothetical protein